MFALDMVIHHRRYHYRTARTAMNDAAAVADELVRISIHSTDDQVRIDLMWAKLVVDCEIM